MDSQDSLNYQYCYSSYSTTYSVSCSDCCCYTDSYNYYPYCCSCIQDNLWVIWLVYSLILVAMAVGVVMVIQVIRRKRQQGIQVPFLTNQLAPNNPNFNTSNEVIIIPSNNPQNPNYQPPNVPIQPQNRNLQINSPNLQYQSPNVQYQSQNVQFQQGIKNQGYLPTNEHLNQGHIERNYRYEQENRVNQRIGEGNVRL